MTPPLYIALRFLRHRKRSFVLSLLGVVFGVAIFICTQAQTQGFAQNFIDSTLGSNGALLLRSRFQTANTGLLVPPKNVRNPDQPRRHSLDGISNAPEIMRISRQFADVASCSPVLRGTVSGRAGFDNATVDREFLLAQGWKSNFLVALGYAEGEPAGERAPRLLFDEACRLL